MFLFALISEVPFDLAFSGKAWYPAYQNVFFTLLLGLLVIAGLHLVEQHFVGTTVGKTILRVGLNAVIILTGCVLGLVLKTDYDLRGFWQSLYFICSVTERKHRCGPVSSFFIDGQPGDVCSTFLYSDLVLQRNERAAE